VPPYLSPVGAVVVGAVVVVVVGFVVVVGDVVVEVVGFVVVVLVEGVDLHALSSMLITRTKPTMINRVLFIISSS